MTSKTVRLIIAALVTMTSLQNGNFSSVSETEKELLSNYILHFLANKTNKTLLPDKNLKEYVEKIDMDEIKILEYSDLKKADADFEINRQNFYVSAITSAFGTTSKI